MTSKSPLVKTFWWIQCWVPVFALVVGIPTSFTARSADEALGAVLMLMPPVIIAVLLAPFVAIRAALSHKLVRKQKVLLVLLSLSVIPMAILAMAVVELLVQQKHPPALVRIGVSLGIVAAWTGTFLWLRARYFGAGQPDA